MHDFWDQKARENPMWFIDSTLDYAHPDAQAFWASGETALRDSLERFGVRLTGSERVLEIGCGMGRITRALAGAAREVVGIDVSEEMIRLGKEALKDLPNVSLRTVSGTGLSDFDNQSFDVGYSFVTFQHIPDPAITANYITELGRVLRPGGWALFQVSQHPDFHRKGYWGLPGWRDRLAVRLGRKPRGCLDPQWLGSTVSREQLADALQNGNLEAEKIVGEGTLFCFVLARARGPKA